MLEHDVFLIPPEESLVNSDIYRIWRARYIQPEFGGRGVGGISQINVPVKIWIWKCTVIQWLNNSARPWCLLPLLFLRPRQPEFLSLLLGRESRRQQRKSAAILQRVVKTPSRSCVRMQTTKSLTQFISPFINPFMLCSVVLLCVFFFFLWNAQFYDDNMHQSIINGLHDNVLQTKKTWIINKRSEKQAFQGVAMSNQQSVGSMVKMCKLYKMIATWKHCWNWMKRGKSRVTNRSGYYGSSTHLMIFFNAIFVTFIES